MGGGSGSSNEAPTAATSTYQDTTAPVAAQSLTDSQQRSWNGTGMNDEETGMFRRGAGAMGQWAQGMSSDPGQQVGPGRAFNPSNGFAFAQNLYTIRR